MSNYELLENLLIQLKSTSILEITRRDFAFSFIDTIESLDDVPYSIINEARDWQYKIETEGDSLQPLSNTLKKALINWATHIQTCYA